jgi:O-antigen ligase
MKEILYIIFLLSGMIKIFLIYFNIFLIVDFTIVFSLIMLVILLKNLFINKFIIHLNKYEKYIIVCLILLFGLILISYLYTTSNDYVIEKTFRYLTIIIAVVYPIIVLNFNTSKFFKYLIIITAALTLLYIPIFIDSYNAFRADYSSYKETNLTIILGSYLTFGYLIGLVLLINIFSKSFIGVNKMILSSFFLITLLSTGARGPILGLTVVVIFYALISIRKVMSIKMIIFLIISFLTVFLVFNNFNEENLLLRSYERLIGMSDNASVNSRFENINFVFSKMEFNNILFGYGFGSFSFEYTGIDGRDYPHNILLELVFELGLLGLLIYIFFLLVLTVKMMKNDEKWLSITIFLYLFLNSLKSLSLVDSRIMFGIFGVLLVLKIKNTKKGKLL